MEGLVREMQDPETGVPVRSQKLFLTSIPSAFMGYDLIEWLMERLNIEDSVEAVHIANQLCNCGYFFPVSDSKNLIVKDDSSLYRFQTPYYWPWQNKSPDKVEYAIYLAKRTLRNKQRHGLEEYEVEALASLKKNLQNKWDFITMQAEEQVRLAKERKKGDKIVSDSQERAYWRVYRPPPGYSSCLESIPIPHRNRGAWQKKKTVEDLKKDVEFFQKCLSRTRIKVSTALENLMQYSETFMEYDSFFTSPQPSNPWVSDDNTFWLINGPLVEVPTEKRVKRWALSIEDLVSDPTGLVEFTNYLRKQFSHENIRFWMAVNDLRRSSQQQIPNKVQQIFEEFLAPGAPCEINIDSKTMEKVHKEMKNPSRFTFDSAAEHVYTLLLKKDCYPRFIRSDHYKNLLAAGVQPSHKKRFENKIFRIRGPVKKKSTTTAPPPSSTLLQQQQQPPQQPTLSRRRGSDRSLSGSAHELAICGVTTTSTSKVSHSHSQSNLSDIPYRDPQGGSSDEAESSKKIVEKDEICPWDCSGVASSSNDGKRKKLGIASCAGSMASEEIWENEGNACLNAYDPRVSRKNSTQLDSGSSSSELSLAIVEVSERLRKTCSIPQQSSFPESDEGKTRKLSTNSADKVVDGRRSSCATAVTTTTTTETITKTCSPGKISTGKEMKNLNQNDISRPSVSSTGEEASLTCLVNSATSLLKQVTVHPQQHQPLTTNKPTQGTCKKKSSLSTTPLISVSSVTEDNNVADKEVVGNKKNVNKETTTTTTPIDDAKSSKIDKKTIETLKTAKSMRHL
ncbi:Regulator of G-protein signaling, putative [Pediculus humanus corporis]|uniref:Regulator of G-protein signaling, putative n=1 Tax=Pediculus humanus subsp. corporis TaxID=121224 RepID=E0W0J6_PEDHC|nr:Regulator of G-protein signaling, putative [Pediculus humanus corporis]EEB19152.1 Regulator of G-protein signaling, putative [Pediculus humanus corporis]